jgi:uncharacterized protein YjdB
MTTSSLTIPNTLKLTPTITPANATYKGVKYVSSNPTIASVNEGGTVLARLHGTATITVTTDDGGKVATCKVYVPPVPVSSVSLNRSSATLSYNNTVKLKETISPANATFKEVAWTSSASKIATVDALGTVRALSHGTTIITVKTNDGNKTATCSVYVPPIRVTAVSLNQTAAAIDIYSSATLSATVLPANATNTNVTWKSSNPNVASVIAGSAYTNLKTARVTALTAGKTTVIVETEDGKLISTCTVTVLALPESVKVLEKRTMYQYETLTLSAVVLPDDTPYKDVVWRSSNNTLATVNTGGGIYARVGGTVTITATLQKKDKYGQNLSSSCTLTIIPEDPAAINMQPLENTDGYANKQCTIYNLQKRYGKTEVTIKNEIPIGTEFTLLGKYRAYYFVKNTSTSGWIDAANLTYLDEPASHIILDEGEAGTISVIAHNTRTLAVSNPENFDVVLNARDVAAGITAIMKRCLCIE